MRLLNETFDNEISVDSFIDEFDRFDEFDLEIISRDYEKGFRLKNDVKYIDDSL